MIKLNIMRRYNLELNENYNIINSYYSKFIDSGVCCDNCNKGISNIAVIKNSKNEVFNVGLDCAETLSDLNGLWDVQMEFSELKSINAKVRKHIKNNEILHFEIYSNGDLSCYYTTNDLGFKRNVNVFYKDIEFSKKYLNQYLDKVTNPEKIGFDYKDIDIDLGFERFIPRTNLNFIKNIVVSEFDVKISVKPYFNSVTNKISNYDFFVEIPKLKYANRCIMYNGIKNDINFEIRVYKFKNYTNGFRNKKH